MTVLPQNLIQNIHDLPLSDEEKESFLQDVFEVAQERKAEQTREPLWIPESNPQHDGYYSEAFEVFFGGSGGGGKTDLLLGLALTAHQKSIFFRREYPQLKEAILRSRELLLKTKARYNGTGHTWRDIPGDRTLEFAACQHETDLEKFRGRPHDLKAFDEVTGFSEQMYRFLSGWARTTNPEQRVRIVCTGNPPTTPEGQWVKQRWGPWLDSKHPYPAEPGELRWYAMIEGEERPTDGQQPFSFKGEMVYPQSRTFYPARVQDNPYLRDSGYVSVLAGLPEPLRSQMLYGDFDIGFSDEERQVIPTAWVEAAQRRWTSDRPEGVPLSATGVDVARGGNDQCVLAKRYGAWIGQLKKKPGRECLDGSIVASWVVDSLEDNEKDTPIVIDVISIGSSPLDYLNENDLNVIGYNAANTSVETDKSGRLGFINKRAASWWKAREILDPNSGQDIALPPDSELLADLTAPTWRLTPRGIQIESKDDIKKRLKRSTDCGDAVIMSLEELSISQYIDFL